MAQQYAKAGFEGLKLFTGAYMGNKPVINMETTIVKAAVDMAHAHGRPVFAHPQNRVGTDNALAGGVDILAHSIPSEARFTDEELALMKEHHVALIPTLMEWTIVFGPSMREKMVQAGVDELKQYFAAGGTILFGTDGGFTSKSDTNQEFEFMGRAMSWHDILASLTTNPVSFFKASNQGRVEQGEDADLVALDADPAADARNFAKVAYTIRDGRIIYKLSHK